MKQEYFMGGTIEKFKDTSAIVKMSDGQKISWPIKNLPDDCLVGTKVSLSLNTPGTDKANKDDVALSMLNEVLKNTE